MRWKPDADRAQGSAETGLFSLSCSVPIRYDTGRIGTEREATTRDQPNTAESEAKARDQPDRALGTPPRPFTSRSGVVHRLIGIRSTFIPRSTRLENRGSPKRGYACSSLPVGEAPNWACG